MSDDRILGRIEKVMLSLIAACVFMGIATTAAPGMQTLVAGVACPSGTTASAVVRYPHVVEPPHMVRNTPLVCLVDGQSKLASHAKVLPALFVVGFAGASAVTVVVSAVVSVVRRAGRPEGPARARTWFEGVRYLPLTISAPFVFMTAYGLYWWRAVDTPHLVTACTSSDGGPATCYDGEPTYRFLALLFGLLAVVGLTTWLIAVVRSAERTRRFRRVWASGVQGTATLIDTVATNTKVNGVTVRRFTYRVEPVDGSAPFTFVETGTTSRASTIGSEVDAIYDPGDPGIAFLLPPGSDRPDPSPVIR